MSTTNTQGREAELLELDSKVDEIIKKISDLVDNVDETFKSIDPRIIEYYNDSNVGKINNSKSTLTTHKLPEFKEWLANTVSDYQATKDYTENLNINPNVSTGAGISAGSTSELDLSPLSITNPSGSLPNLKNNTDLPNISTDLSNIDITKPNTFNNNTSSTLGNNTSFGNGTKSNANQRLGTSYGANNGIENSNRIDEDIAAALKDTIEEDTNLLGSVGNGLSNIISSVRPSVSTGKAGSSGSTLAGLAGVAGLGTMAGGGYLIGKKVSDVKFGPRDWNALSEETKSQVLETLKNVGYDEEQISTLKTKMFKVKADVLTKHGKKIKKISDSNPEVTNAIKEQYGFTIISEEGKIKKYLLFLVMIIDGKNGIDKYNIYNIVNEYIEVSEDVEFTYSGLDMEECIVRDEESEEIEILNDPIQSNIDTNNDSLDESSSSKDWLKEIGAFYD